MENLSPEGERNGSQDCGKGEEPVFENRLMPADPEFGEGCRYCWPLDNSDAEVMLRHGEYYDTAEELLDDHPFYPSEMSENKTLLEEWEFEKREELRAAGALTWEYRFFACSAIYAALVHKSFIPTGAYQRSGRYWQDRRETAPSEEEIDWVTWRRLFPFLVRPDTGPMLSALLHRNNLVEPHWNSMREGFLDQLLDWDRFSANWGEEGFEIQLGDVEAAKEGLTRALHLLGIGQDILARNVERSIAAKRFAPLCNLLKDANPPGPRPPTLGAGTFAPSLAGGGLRTPSLGSDENNPKTSPETGGPYSLCNYIKDLVLSQQTEQELFTLVLNDLSNFEPMNVLVSFDEETANMSRLALFDLFADMLGNPKSSLLSVLDSIENDWASKEFESLEEFLLFVERTVKVPKETREAILRHYKSKAVKLSINDGRVAELTTAFLLLAVLAIAPLFDLTSNRPFLVRPLFNPPAFAMISPNTVLGARFRDWGKDRSAPTLRRSAAPRQGAPFMKEGEDVPLVSPLSLPPAELAAADQTSQSDAWVSTYSGLAIPNSHGLNPPGVVFTKWNTAKQWAEGRGGSYILRTRGPQATMAGSVGGRHELAEVCSKIEKKSKDQGWKLKRVEHDHVTTDILASSFEIRDRDVTRDISTAILLSKSAHRNKTKASRVIYNIPYDKNQADIWFSEYLILVEERLCNNFAAKLSPRMLGENGFDSCPDLQNCLRFAMKRGRALYNMAIRNWEVKGNEVFPMFFARATSRSACAESRAFLKLWQKNDKLSENHYASLEEKLVGSAASSKERVRARLIQYCDHMAKELQTIRALQSPYSANSRPYLLMDLEVRKLRNAYGETIHEAGLLYGTELSLRELHIESFLRERDARDGLLSPEAAIDRLLIIDGLNDLTQWQQRRGFGNQRLKAERSR